MNAVKLLAWLVLPLVALVIIGVLAVQLFEALLGLAVYLVIGAGVVVGAGYLYRRTRRAIGPGTRTQRRLEAAARTYRQREH